MKNLIIVLLFLLTALYSFGQKPLDTSSVEMHIAREFISAMNNPDIEAMREFTLNYRTEKALERTPIETRLKSYQNFKEKLGHLEMGPVDKYEKGNLKLFVYSKERNSWFKMGFKMGPSDRLEGFSFMPARNPHEKSRKQSSKSQVKSIVRKGIAPGVSMVVIRNGKIDKTVAYGLKNKITKSPVKIEDPFHLGSVSKSFTASLIGNLIDENKISLGTKLKDIFPFDLHAAYQEVSVRDVMNHKGGIPTYLTDEEGDEARLLALPGNPRDQRLAFAKEILRQEPKFTPSQKMNYSNAGYSILASICEIIADKSWEEQLRKIIFDPLDMTSAGIGWPSEAENRNPVGHTDQGETLDMKDYYIGPYLEPAGDIHCSMKDLAKYAIAHLNGLNGKNDFISSSSLKEIHRLEEGEVYGGGWMVEEVNGATIYSHGGSAGTFFAYIALKPENNSAYVIASNSGNFEQLGIFKEIIKL